MNRPDQVLQQWEEQKAMEQSKKKIENIILSFSKTPVKAKVVKAPKKKKK